MVMVGQQKRLAQPMRPGRREVWLLATLAALCVAAAIALAVVALVGGDQNSTSHAGCVNVTIPSTTGGATLHACGQKARSWCASEAARPDAFAKFVLPQCRKAGYQPA
jgi:hypothetical protein